MKGFVFVACVLAALVGASLAQNPATDKITNLPGLNMASLNYTMYSGYIPVSTDRHYFYWFIESSNNPSTDPIVLWLNGGPGCSSMAGLLSENGPFYPDAKGNLIINDWAWNKKANVLYVESPAGVGFSYSDRPTPFNDNKTASDNYEVLYKFFQGYSSFASNPLYLSGESYAGHYLPQLALKIYENTAQNPNSAPHSNLKGFLVGNPATQEDIDFDKPLTQYYQTHGLLQLDDNNQRHVVGRIDPYDILGDVCTAKRMKNYIRFPHPLIDRMREMDAEDQDNDSHGKKRYVRNGDPCIDNHVTSYLNTASVQKALHVKPVRWEECGGPDYAFYHGSIIPTYITLMEKTNYKILVYSGDSDTVINFISTQTWILQLKRQLVSSWKPWYYTRDATSGSQVGGWGVVFDRISFKTVKGAGHMVPWTQPAPALQMFADFLAGK